MAEKEYIERDKVLALINEHREILLERDRNGIAEKVLGAIAAVISDKGCFPAADVVPVKHGHYIDKTEWYTRLGLCRYECSVCYAKIPHKPNTSQLYRDNYCPNCGTRMDGKDGESNG